MVVPKLRFKEFKDEMLKYKISDLVEIVDCKHDTAPIESEETIYKMIRTGNVRNGNLIVNTMDSVNEETYQKWSLRGYLEPNDIILTREAPMGEVALIPNHSNYKFFLGQRCLQLKTNNDTILPIFMYLLLQSKTFNKYIRPLKASGSTVSNIRIPELKSFEFFVPSKNEQKKIGDIFTAINKKIQLQQEKVDLLKEQKKGFMQKIFSQELRFKDTDGQAFSEWEKKLIGEIGDVIMGQSPDGSSYSEDSSDTVLVQGNADLKHGKIVPRIYTSQITKMATIGDIILTVRAPVGVVAKCNIPACIGRGVCVIRSDDFLFYYLDYYYITSQWTKLSQGSTFESVNSNDIKNIIFPQPSSQEKEEIISFFDRLTQKIHLAEAALSELEKQKQAFMQQMFI